MVANIWNPSSVQLISSLRKFIIVQTQQTMKINILLYSSLTTGSV